MYVATLHLTNCSNGALSVVFSSFPSKEKLIAAFHNVRKWSAEEWQVVLQKFLSFNLPTETSVKLSPCGTHTHFYDTNMLLTLQLAIPHD